MNADLAAQWGAQLTALLGILVGVTVQIALIGIGVGSLFSTHPWLAEALRKVSAGYLLAVALMAMAARVL